MKLLSLLFVLTTFSVSAFADLQPPRPAPETPLLSWSHSGGFIRAPFQNRGCMIYDHGVVITANGRFVSSRDLRFSPEIRNLEQLRRMILLAHTGRLFSARGVVPDVGTSLYQALWRGTILLERDSFPRSLRNSSPAAGALVRFINFNCR